MLNQIGLKEPSHNAIFSDGVLYVFVGGDQNPSSVFGSEPIEDVYTLNLSNWGI